MEYKNYLAHFNKNHDPRTGKFSKKNGVNSERKLVNKKAVVTGLAAGGILAGTLAAKYAMAAKRMNDSWNESELDPTPALLRIRKQNMNSLRKNAVVQTGKRFVLGALAGYGGYVLTKDGLFEKKGGEK